MFLLFSTGFIQCTLNEQKVVFVPTAYVF